MPFRELLRESPEPCTAPALYFRWRVVHRKKAILGVGEAGQQPRHPLRHTRMPRERAVLRERQLQPTPGSVQKDPCDGRRSQIF